MINKKILIFTDGASKGNPGPGGYGAVVIYPETLLRGLTNEKVIELGGGEKHTTNNRMELMGAVKAMEKIRQCRMSTGEEIIVYTDSKYLIGGMTGWIYGWQKNGWKTTERKEVANKDLWEKLVKLIQDKKITWNYVGGHVGIVGNERCDEIADAFATNKKIILYNGPLSEYKLKIKNLGHNEILKKNKYSKSAKAYSYLSLVDGVLKIDQTWSECEKRVKGKKNTQYKKALNPEHEQEIIKSWGFK